MYHLSSRLGWQWELLSFPWTKPYHLSKVGSVCVCPAGRLSTAGTNPFDVIRTVAPTPYTTDLCLLSPAVGYKRRLLEVRVVVTLLGCKVLRMGTAATQCCSYVSGYMSHSTKLGFQHLELIFSVREPSL